MNSPASSSYLAARTALSLIDPYNDFLSEGGKLNAPARPVIDAMGAEQSPGALSERLGIRLNQRLRAAPVIDRSHYTCWAAHQRRPDMLEHFWLISQG